MVTEWARLDTALFWTLVAAFLSSLGWVFKILHDASAFHQTVYIHGFCHSYFTKEEKLPPPSWDQECPVVVQSRCLPKEERGSGDVGIHSSKSPGTHPVPQGSKLQPSPAVCCLECTHVCDEFTEGGVKGQGRECLFLLTSQMLHPSHFLSSCQIFPVCCHSQQLTCLVSRRFFSEELTTPARPVVHFTQKYLSVHALNRSFFSISSAAGTTLFFFFPYQQLCGVCLKGVVLPSVQKE